MKQNIDNISNSYKHGEGKIPITGVFFLGGSCIMMAQNEGTGRYIVTTAKLNVRSAPNANLKHWEEFPRERPLL